MIKRNDITEDALIAISQAQRAAPRTEMEQDEKLRSNGARTLERIADKCDEVLREEG